jgi:hypothetical protein
MQCGIDRAVHAAACDGDHTAFANSKDGGDFLRDSRGAGFWHETYSRQGMEADYIDMPEPAGFDRFAPERQPTGPFHERAAADGSRLTRQHNGALR